MARYFFLVSCVYVIFSTATCLAPVTCEAVLLKQGFSIPTASPDEVETFDPDLLMAGAGGGRQVKIQSMQLETRVRLRYARTRIMIDLHNSHDQHLQANFRIILPTNAFFTIFKLRRGSEPRLHPAIVTEKERARNIFHYAHTKTNGTMTAGYIELLDEDDVSAHKLMFTVGPNIRIVAYLVYETLLERKDRRYNDQLQIYPIEANSSVDNLEFLVDIQEPENIKQLRCTDTSQEHYINCSSEVQYSGPKRVGLKWKSQNVTGKALKEHPFAFYYELHQPNTSSAVIIHQRNGNTYFAHLFVPENLPQINKHFVFVLDVSDSMHGKKLEQLKWGMIEILDDLSHQDFFSIITFNNEAKVWSKFGGEMSKCPIPYPATEEFKQAARFFIRTQLSAQGTTNIYSAMTTAFDLIQLFSPKSSETCDKDGDIRTPAPIRSKHSQKLPPNVESVVFFLSDGNATSGLRDTRVILKSLSKINREAITDPVQICTVAFGDTADREFLRMLASENSGYYKFIEIDSDAGVQLAHFYAEISSHILSRVRSTVEVNGTDVTHSKLQTLPDRMVLINGSEVLTARQVFMSPETSNCADKSPPSYMAQTRASGAIGDLTYHSPIYDCRSLDTTLDYCLDKLDIYLERLQAFLLLKRLMKQDKIVQAGYTCPKWTDDDGGDFFREEENYYDEYDEAKKEDCVNPYKQQIIELGVKFHFVTPYTSFILCTPPNIDLGLKAKGDFGKRPPRRKPMGMLQPQISFNVEPDANPNGEVATILEERPPPSSAQGNSPQHINLARLRMWSPANLVGGEEPSPTSITTPTPRPLYTKKLQNFVVSMFQKLFASKQKKQSDNSTLSTTLPPQRWNLNDTQSFNTTVPTT